MIERLLADAQLSGQFCERSPGLRLVQGIRDLLLGEVLLSNEFLFLLIMTDSENSNIRHGSGKG